MWVWSILLLSVGVCYSSSSDLASRLPAGHELIVPRLSTSFSCTDRGLGYYADTDLECLVFHMCSPFYRAGRLVRTNIFSFICPNGTIFSQDSLTCAYKDDAFPCQDAPSIYDQSNSFVGVVPEEKKKV